MCRLAAKSLVLFSVACLLLSVLPVSLAQVNSKDWNFSRDWQVPSSGVIANVSFTVGFGGLFWVNNTVVTNQSWALVDNGSLLVLAAAPSIANYSFSSFSLNGTLQSGNPYVYNVTFSVNASSIVVGASFVANSIPSPTPVPDLTVDDAAGLAVVFGLLSAGVCVSLVLIVLYRGRDEH